MAVMNVSDIVIFERDENGDLLPIMMELRSHEGKHIRMVPMSRGEILKLRAEMPTGSTATTKDQDMEIVEKHLVEPKLTRDQLDRLRLDYFQDIAWTIISTSMGLEKDKVLPESDGLLTEGAVKKNTAD